VVDRTALRVDPANPGTGIHAVQVDTRQSRRAVCVNRAFRPACYIGVTEILRNALACSGSVPTRASSIAPTGGGVAGIYNFCWCKWGGDTDAGSKGISGVAWVTSALWDMVCDGAGGMVATHSGARVHTVL
jgi:hypothetical protein